MTKINFDQDLMRNIRIIYGDADLDNMTLLNIYETWQRNPEIIRNTARLKMGNLEGPKAIELAATPAPLQIILVLLEIADDDLRGVLNFGAAFKEARSRGLKLFRWGKGVYGTLLALKPSGPSVNLRPLPKPESSVPESSVPESSVPELPNMQNQLDLENRYISYKLYHKRYPLAYLSKSWNPGILPYERRDSIWTKRGLESPWGEESEDFEENRGFSLYEIRQDRLKNPQYYQQGGTMNNQQELQKAFVAYLILDAQTLGVQILSEQDLQTYAEQLGEDGIKAKYQEFVQRMQGGSTMARLGAKLQYYKKLKGACPEGEEMVYFKLGGRICKSCQKKQQQAPMAQGGKKMNAIDEFKNKKKDINPNDTVNTKKGPRDLNGKTKYPKWNPSKEENSIEERIRVVEKDEKSGKKVFGSKCGAKMKKKK